MVLVRPAFLLTQSSSLLLLLLLQTMCVSAFPLVLPTTATATTTRRTVTRLFSTEMAAAEDGRREFLVSSGNAGCASFLVTMASSLLWYPATASNAADTVSSSTSSTTSSLSDLLPLIKEARSQLDGIPKLIAAEKWDSVRAILIKPPLSDCWTKTARPLLPLYAEAIGATANGDELAALEAKEELISHLRYLDMSVYNNNFNPIKSEGTNGASKELVRSYYEDPTNEWKASVQVLDELIQLAEKS